MRECCNEKEVNYGVFRQWLGNSIPNISEDMWSNILQEDLAFDYSTRGSGLGAQASVSDECDMTTESSDVINATEDGSEYTES